jgi:hypothetical protein
MDNSDSFTNSSLHEDSVKENNTSANSLRSSRGKSLTSKISKMESPQSTNFPTKIKSNRKSISERENNQILGKMKDRQSIISNISAISKKVFYFLQTMF